MACDMAMSRTYRTGGEGTGWWGRGGEGGRGGGGARCMSSGFWIIEQRGSPQPDGRREHWCLPMPRRPDLGSSPFVWGRLKVLVALPPPGTWNGEAGSSLGDCWGLNAGRLGAAEP